MRVGDYLLFYTGIHQSIRWVEIASYITWISVKVRACNEVIVYICSELSVIEGCYTLYIGTQNNTKSALYGQRIYSILLKNSLPAFRILWVTDQSRCYYILYIITIKYVYWKVRFQMISAKTTLAHHQHVLQLSTLMLMFIIMLSRL